MHTYMYIYPVLFCEFALPCRHIHMLYYFRVLFINTHHIFRAAVLGQRSTYLYVAYQAIIKLGNNIYMRIRKYLNTGSIFVEKWTFAIWTLNIM